MRNTKKAISILLCFILMIGSVAVGFGGFGELLDAISVKAGAEDAVSGECGDNLTWSYDTSTKALTISGTGAINDYARVMVNGNYITNAPWQPYCDSMQTVVIQNGVTNLGRNAFYGCTGLTSVSIPGSVSELGQETFRDCSSLTSVTIPIDVTRIGDWLFAGCSSLTNIVIPAGVTSIEPHSFADCTAVTGITVASGNTVYHSAGNCIIETTSKKLIKGCVTSVIPSDGSVTSIGESAFENTAGLTSIAIPAGITSIGNFAFICCTDLTSVTIPDTVTSIGTRAFADCTALTSITVASGNPVYHSEGNCIIETASKKLIAGCKSSAIPDDGSVTSIGEYAFCGCSGLTSIEIPDGVTSIGSFAFEYCTGLTSVTITDSIESIGINAFEYCTALTSLTIPDGITRIDSLAFPYCTGLGILTIPNSVTSIAIGAFCMPLELTDEENIARLQTIYEAATAAGKTFYDYVPLEVYRQVIDHPNGSLTDVYFDGTEEEWNAVSIEDYNAALANATIHFRNPVYTLTYDANGGEGVPDTQTGNGAITLSADEPTRDEYIFMGWATSATAAEAEYQAGASYDLTADTTLYAVWQMIQYTLDYDANGGSGAPDTQTGNGAITLSADEPTRDEYIFMGWATSATAAEAEYQAGASYDLTADTTLYAVWQMIQYTLDYDANGGSGAPDTQTGNGAITLSADEPTRSEYIFMGWATSATATEAEYQAGASYTLSADTTLYAVWEKIVIPTVSIKNYTPFKSVNYKATSTYKAITTDAPADSSVHWFINGEDVYTGEKYTVNKAENDYTVQAKLIGADDSVLAESETESVEVKNSFCDRLTWFFTVFFTEFLSKFIEALFSIC